jgi:divalent metal cation (Fe/Co/Zn/Cd) transporter
VALACFGRSLRAENLAALAIAGVMFVAGCHTAYDLWHKIVTGRRPEFWVAGWSSFTMVSIALLLLGVMWRFRKSENALVAATWLSSRNSIIITLCFAAISLFARTRDSQGAEIALDLLAIGLSFQAVYAILTKLRWYTTPENTGESRS